MRGVSYTKFGASVIPFEHFHQLICALQSEKERSALRRCHISLATHDLLKAAESNSRLGSMCGYCNASMTSPRCLFFISDSATNES